MDYGNKFIFESKVKNPANLIQRILANLEEFREAQKLAKGTEAREVLTRVHIKWNAPVEGITKVNIDAAIVNENKKLRIGQLARSSRGEVMFSAYTGKLFSGNSSMAECYAL